MSYATATLPARRIIETGYKTLDSLLKIVTTVTWIAVQVPLHGIKIYMPMFLISTAAAYASAQFAGHSGLFPFPLDYMQAFAYEWVYIGTLAMVGVKRGRWYYVVLGAGALTAVMYITMYSAYHYELAQQIDAILPENARPVWHILITLVLILVHALPLTFVNVVYGLLIHQHNREIADKQREIEARHYCPYGCGYWSKSEPAVRGHKAQCSKRPTN